MRFSLAGTNGWWANSGGGSSSSSTPAPSSSGSGWWGTSSRGSSGPAKRSGSGGGLFGEVGHFIADKASRAGHDIAAIPGGVYAVNKALVHDVVHGPGSPFAKPGAKSELLPLAKQQAQATVQSVEHPLRDPFQTALTVGPVVHGLGRVGEVAARVDNTVPRTLRQGETEVGLPPRSKNAAVRTVQRGYDKTVQKALNENEQGAASGRVSSRVAAHGARRIGAQIQEAERPRQQMRRVVADQLDHAGKELRGKLGNHGFKNSKMAQLALKLTSENVTPKEMHDYHVGQAVKGVAPKANMKLAKLYRQMDVQGMLRQDEHGDVQVNAAKFPRLAAADSQLARAQAEGSRIINEYGLMSPEGELKRLNDPGNLVRGETRQARGYVTHQQLEKRAAASPVARVSNQVVGEAKSPIPKTRTFKGEAQAQGKVPLNTSRLAAQHLRDLIRYENTSELRQRWLETGSDTRRSPRDILVRIPGEKAATLTPEQEALLGRGKLTAAEDQAHTASLREYVNHLVPGNGDEVVRAWEQAHEIGAKAPAGYKWVDQGTLGDLKNAFAASRGGPGRVFDNINSAVTAATVYFKVGHVGTRVLTDAATNIIEGSIKHAPKSIRLWKTLTPEERLKALAASGQHGFNAMPHEGVGKIGAVATKGANFWAKHADAPFRFNAIAYEAAKAGYKTPVQFRDFLAKLENPKGLSAAERAKVENVAKLTNRENISYDRLNDRERRYIARGLWFYPWVKGSSAYTVRALLEHPFKAFALGQAAQVGKREQANALGAMPSYEYGLVPLGGSRVSDFQTFSPMGTLASLLQLPKYGAAADNLNPAATALLHLATRTNQYGQHSNTPIVDAIKAAVAPTPEAQILEAALGKKSKMFPSSSPTWMAFLRALEGPAQPRTVNIADLNKAAGLEKAGR